MSVDQRIRDAEIAFLNAPFNNEGWIHALRLMAFATGGEVAQLCGGGPGLSLTFNYFSQDRHDPHGHLVNPAMYGEDNWRINCSMGGARTIQDERHYEEYREGRRTGFYDDAVSDLDLPFGCQTPLMLDRNGLVGLALLRSSRDGRCTPETLAAFARIAYQAHRAVRVQMALGQEGGEQMLAGLAETPEMTVLLDRQGQVVAMTPAAETLFDCPVGLQLDGLAVRLASASEDRAFRAALARLLASDGRDGPILHETVAGRCESHPQGHWRLFLTRLPGGQDLLGFAAQFALTLRPLA